MNTSSERYIHSFEPDEQARLIRQGRFLEPWIQPTVDFSGCASVLEVGCGVGAQLQVLLRRFPDTRFTGIDASATQLERARGFLSEAVAAGRVELTQASAFCLPFPDASFDGACIYWVLEHLPDHVGALREVLRVLKPGGVLYCTEVFNSGLYAHPPQPALASYWRAFNTLQEELGGDPDAGVRLAALFERAGFERIAFYEPLLTALSALQAHPGVHRAGLQGDRLHAVTLPGTCTAATLQAALGAAGCLDAEVLPADPTLDDVFTELALRKTNPQA